jgi:5'(3')-deoxyribonucleotidase
MIQPGSVAFDIDGVVADTMRLFLDIAREEFNLNGIRYEDISCYNLEECLDIDGDILDAIISKILTGEYRAPLKPVEGAPEVLAAVGRRHSPLLFVTARPHPGPIREWVQRTLPLDGTSVDIVATGSFEAKSGVLLDRGISYFVEDRLETCFLLQDVGIRPLLFRQPWNRKNHPFVEVNNWLELAALIEF